MYKSKDEYYDEAQFKHFQDENFDLYINGRTSALSSISNYVYTPYEIAKNQLLREQAEKENEDNENM